VSWLDIDPAVVAAAVDGDAQALDRVVQASLRPVLDWCIRLGGPTVDADDLAHDVIVLVLRKLDGLRQPERYPSWLFSLTRREIVRRRRRARLRALFGGPLAQELRDLPDPDPGPEVAVVRRRTASLLTELLHRLPEAQRVVLVLCDAEGRSASEAAALLGIPPGTVKSRLRLGRRRFRALAASSGLDIEPDADARALGA